MGHHSDQEAIFKTIAMLVVLGTTGLIHGYRKFVLTRKIEDTPKSKIASAPQGLVEIEGQAWPTDKIRTMDGRWAAYYSIVVQRLERQGKSNTWVTVYSDISANSILVTDATGSCLVDPASAQLDTIERIVDPKDLTDSEKDCLANCRPFLCRYLPDPGLIGTLMSDKYRFVENKVLAGAPIYVRGSFMTDEDSHAVAIGDHKSYVSQWSRIQSPGYQVRMFDSNHDGKLSDEELINGHAAAANAFVRKEEVQSVRIYGHISAQSEHGLVIADTFEKYLVKRTFLTYNLSMIGGAIGLALGLYLLLRQIGLN